MIVVADSEDENNTNLVHTKKNKKLHSKAHPM